MAPEKLNAAGRNAILVAPTLGARSGSRKTSRRPGGLDAYLTKVLAAVEASWPRCTKAQGQTPSAPVISSWPATAGAACPCGSWQAAATRPWSAYARMLGLRLYTCITAVMMTPSGPAGPRKTPSAKNCSTTSRAAQSRRAIGEACAPCGPLCYRPTRQGRAAQLRPDQTLVRAYPKGAVPCCFWTASGTAPHHATQSAGRNQPISRPLSHAAFIEFVGSSWPQSHGGDWRSGLGDGRAGHRGNRLGRSHDPLVGEEHSSASRARAPRDPYACRQRVPQRKAG